MITLRFCLSARNHPRRSPSDLLGFVNDPSLAMRSSIQSRSVNRPTTGGVGIVAGGPPIFAGVGTGRDASQHNIYISSDRSCRFDGPQRFVLLWLRRHAAFRIGAHAFPLPLPPPSIARAPFTGCRCLGALGHPRRFLSSSNPTVRSFFV